MELAGIEEFIDHGKQAFLKYGTLVPNFYWETVNGETGACACIAPDMQNGPRSNQHMLAAIFGRTAAQKNEKREDGLKRVIFGSEAWTAKFKPGDTVPPSLQDLPNKKEILIFMDAKIILPRGSRNFLGVPETPGEVHVEAYLVDVIRMGSSLDLGATQKEEVGVVTDTNMIMGFLSGWESHRLDDMVANVAGKALDAMAAELGLVSQRAEDFLAGL